MEVVELDKASMRPLMNTTPPSSSQKTTGKKNNWNLAENKDCCSAAAPGHPGWLIFDFYHWATAEKNDQ